MKRSLARCLLWLADLMGPEDIVDPKKQRMFIWYSALLGCAIGFVVGFFVLPGDKPWRVPLFTISFGVGWTLMTLLGARLRRARSDRELK